MNFSTSIAAACVIAVAGCASTENSNVAPQQPVAHELPPVAAAAVQDKTSEANGRGAVRDTDGLLSKRSVYFDFDDYVVKPEYAPMLERHGKVLLGRQAAKIIVQGHADERGSHEYNLALGQKRAEAVRRTLLLHGAKDEQLEAVSFGEEKPSAQGSGEEAWSLNRRADLAYPVK